MNKARVRRLAAHLRTLKRAEDVSAVFAEELRKEPFQFFNMKYYISQDNASCGTAGCIAGHAVDYFDPGVRRAGIREKATDILDLTREEASALFVPIIGQFGVTDYNEVTPEVAAGVLEAAADGTPIYDAWEAELHWRNYR